MIVFCGYANTDIVARVPQLPADGERVHADTIDYHHGGMGANAAVAAARLGADARFAGAVGATARDNEFLDTLADSGVDTAWCTRNDTLPTCVILVTPDGERSVISHDDGLTASHLTHAARRLRDHGGGWLYVDGYRWPTASAALAGVGATSTMPTHTTATSTVVENTALTSADSRVAGTTSANTTLSATPGSAANPAPFHSSEESRGVQVFVDLDGCADRAAAETALSHAQYVVVGQSLLRALFGTAVDPAVLAARHDTTLLVTAGAAGWTLAEPDGRVVHGRAHPVAVVDTTGAGDCFAGAYLAGLDRGDSPVHAARTAAVAAGLSCTVAGPRGSPTLSILNTALHGAASEVGTLTKEDPP